MQKILDNDEPTCGKHCWSLMDRKLIEEGRNRFINTLYLIETINRFVRVNSQNVFQTIEIRIVPNELSPSTVT